MKGLIVLAEGTRQDFLTVLIDQSSFGLQLNRVLCVSDKEEQNSAIEKRFEEFGYRPEFLSYSDLRKTNAMTARGKSVLLISPAEAINESDARGMIDGGLVKLLTSKIWRNVLAFHETDAPLGITQVRALDHLSEWISRGINERPKAWFYEILLTLLYRRHESVRGLQRLLAKSVWSQLVRTDTASAIRQARAEFLRENLISERKGSLTCSESGRRAVEDYTPFDKIECPGHP